MNKLRALAPAMKGPTVLAFLAVSHASSHWPMVTFAVCWLFQKSLAAAMDRLSSVQGNGFVGRFRRPPR